MSAQPKSHHNQNKYQALLKCAQSYADGLKDDGKYAEYILDQISAEVIAIKTDYQPQPAPPKPEENRNAFLWCLLFGPLYFAYKGKLLTALIAFIGAFATVGISHLVFPFFARSIVEKKPRR